MKQTKTAKTRRHSIGSKVATAQLIDQGAAQASEIPTSPSRTRVVSFRVTEEQHAQLVACCKNGHGEQLLTPSEYARYAVLYQRAAHTTELPSERYRLAIAAQLTTALTDVVQYLDAATPISHEKHIHGFQTVCDELAKIQESILLLLNNTNKLPR